MNLGVALNGNNVELVTWACKEIDSNKLTFPSLKLGQTFILCLLQQLSFDLNVDAKVKVSLFQLLYLLRYTTKSFIYFLKLNWLKECCLSLDVTDTLISEYVPNVLKIVQVRFYVIHLRSLNEL